MRWWGAVFECEKSEKDQEHPSRHTKCQKEEGRCTPAAAHAGHPPQQKHHRTEERWKWHIPCSPQSPLSIILFTDCATLHTISTIIMAYNQQGEGSSTRTHWSYKKMRVCLMFSVVTEPLRSCRPIQPSIIRVDLQICSTVTCLTTLCLRSSIIDLLTNLPDNRLIVFSLVIVVEPLLHN